MDDRESPTNDLQVNVDDLLRADTHVEKINTCLASSPDENENPLNGSRQEALKSRDKVMGITEQDSINNNEGEDSGICATHCKESLSDTLIRSSSTDEMLVPETCIPENKSSRKTKSCVEKVAKQKKTAVAAIDCMQEEDGNKTNPANGSPKDPTQTLQTLFSLLPEEFEQMDSRVLPLCLHQIAETYFQDGEYEKAITFIQLEQLYHEQLLANLSSIQQQWEKKWKAAASSEVPGLKNSAKGLNNEKLDKLAELCTSHQEPLVSRSKLISEEKSWTHNSFIGLMGSEELKERGAAACNSDTETWAGIGPRPEHHHHAERQRSESFQPDSRHTLSKRASLQLAVRKDHMEEEHRSAESRLESPTQSPGVLGRLISGCLSSKDATEDNSLQLRGEQSSEDVSKTEAAAEEPAAECSSEPVVDALVLTNADHMPCDLISIGDSVKSDRNVLQLDHCLGSSVLSSGHLGSSILKQQQQPVYKNDRKSVPCRTSLDIRENVYSESNTPEQATAGYAEASKGIQETTELEEESEGSEDFFQQFLNCCIKDREESVKYLGTPEDSDTFSHIPAEQALYSSSEGYSLEESFSSLDELAKRIEIAETAPTEGLVSILKKRDDAEGKALAQMQQRQSKRRVRFQEMEDTFDQEEAGGGSCVLLILLCIATVFLSVGGTALYCTFGDTESPVCTDFAANVDFYCTQILQGMEELKHWISFS
ncbi:PREDICTED: consortin [Gekko japonicus]|uniref:Consortin n=1 Tax=Gekko japonicus TaxID=146911 RepID=A0ABM1JR46_GEKJA|nr:PREDICTED: consortin [Gekko japonicus]